MLLQAGASRALPAPPAGASRRARGAGAAGGRATRVSSAARLAPHLHNITIPSLTFSSQPSHPGIPLTFSPSHHRLLLLRSPLEVLPHLHPPLLPPGSHLHPASSLSAPVRAFSLPAHASIPGPPWSQAPGPRISGHPACRLPHPSWQLPRPGLGSGRAAARPLPLRLRSPPGTSEAGPPAPAPPRPSPLASCSRFLLAGSRPRPSGLRLRWLAVRAYPRPLARPQSCWPWFAARRSWRERRKPGGCSSLVPWTWAELSADFLPSPKSLGWPVSALGSEALRGGVSQGWTQCHLPVSARAGWEGGTRNQPGAASASTLHVGAPALQPRGAGFPVFGGRTGGGPAGCGSGCGR